MVKNREVIIVYDGECPFCKNYCKLIKLKKAAGKVTLVDARQPSPIMEKITARNLDIDQGMVVDIEGKIYYGSDAINVLSLLSRNSDFFNRINFLIFRSKKISFVLYPFLKTCRNVALWLLNIQKINNLKSKEAS